MKFHQLFRNQSEPNGRSSIVEGFAYRLEVIGLGIVALIASSFLYRLLSWFGVPDRAGFSVALVFGVTTFWLISMFWMWAAMEGENRRKAARDRDVKGSAK
ncbi:hypothetical protein EI545_01625 [Tabrizicola piscis]|uniref:Uncharacterized protein n=1 Tax=Tabrizicola piscis TaxID=2494374 RepID=A0A3S8U262_9RHOB|nr:hypothetical protein [Tabrizicola piscis]AZL57655.1 hypothetical protein EI545_01625 [Tabrizicola piscis]